MNGSSRFTNLMSAGRYSPNNYGVTDLRRNPALVNQHAPSGAMFGMEDNMLRVEALAALSHHELKSASSSFKPDLYGEMNNNRGPHPVHIGFQQPGESVLDQMTANSSLSVAATNLVPFSVSMSDHQTLHPPYAMYSHPNHSLGVNTTTGNNILTAANAVINHHHPSQPMQQLLPTASTASHTGMVSPEMESDPRELETFAEKFKQRRIKLGVTQSDVGRALGNLKIVGVGSLSQSTICRFESLTLSHNNMIALKPVLHAWLEDAERAANDKRCASDDEGHGSHADRKRKRTSIAAPEKRSLEAYFSIQPRPSGEKIAQIADKLDLKKNVVRVWFCNQRQKQKRMKFASPNGGSMH